MSGAPPPPRNHRRALIASVGALAIAAGALAWIFGPGGPTLVAHIAEGRSVWRLGKLHLEGVSGGSLGDLHVARATLRDGDGVWAEAENLSLGWDPAALARGLVTIRTASAVGLHVLRQPKLTAPEPEGGSIDVDLAELAVRRIDIEPAVLGEKAAFRLDGGLTAKGGRVGRAVLNAERLDAPGDALHLDFERTPLIRLDARMDGPAGGFFAAALKSNDAVAFTSSATGTDDAGAGRLDATVGRASLASGNFSWTAQRWTGAGAVSLAVAPALAPLAETFGAMVRVSGAGDRFGARAFAAALDSEHVGIAAGGRLGEDLRPAGPLDVTAHADRLRTFVPGVHAGGARFEGKLAFDSAVTTASGRLDGVAVESAGVSVSFSGPARVRLTKSLADIDADVTASASQGIPAVTRLLRGGRLTLAGRYDRAAARFVVRTGQFTSPTADISGDGALGFGASGLKGRWRVKQLGAVDPHFGGAGDGAWTLSGGFHDRPFALAANGAISRLTTTLQPLDQMLGAAPRLETTLAIHDGVIGVRTFTVTAPKLRLGATGRIERGRAALTFEASAQGPVMVGAAQLAGVADVRGALNGDIGDPAITAEARMRQLDVAGLTVANPVATFAFAPLGGGRRGRFDLKGAIGGDPVTASALLAADGNGLALHEVSLNTAGFAAHGEAAFTHAGPSFAVTYAGAVDKLAAPLRGRVSGAATLKPAARGAPILSADAHLAHGALGALALTRLDAAVTGPLDALGMRASLRGAASGQSVAFDGAGTVTRIADATRLRLEGSGAVADTAVATRSPVEITVSPNAASGGGAFTLGDGAARFQLTDAKGRLSLAAVLENAPIASIFALLGERATGRASGTLSASGSDDALDGKIDMAVDDALFARRARDPVSMKLAGTLKGGLLTLHADATSRGGLDAVVDARAPVNARARPMRIALAGEGSATWRAKGPADALWGLVGSLDQAVAGQVDGQGTVRFAVGRLSGEGGLTLAQGRFADKPTGVDLRDIAARIRFDDAGARLEQFFARDARGGTLIATGAASGVKNGHIELVASDVQLLGRPDARATGSGPLSLKWTPDGATLSGDLQISDATLLPPRANNGIPQLDVIEINRPDTIAVEERKPALAAVANLDLRVRAPGRVFLRGRGLDTEWAMDMRVKGTSAAPEVYGDARLVRGRFTLAGRPFEAQRGAIHFNGAPEEALIDLVAQLSSPELTVNVALAGPVSDPDVQLSSTPALPEDEILPQALFGRAAADLSALEAAQLAASLAELAGRSSLNIAGAARDLVGLDRLDVRDTGTGLRVAGGKYLTRDVYLEVARTGVGEAETQVEWRVRPQLYLISAFDPSGDRKLSVRWRREY